MPTFKIWTLGCKVNQYDGQSIREMLFNSGWKEACADEAINLCIINSCVVTSRAEASTRHLVRQAARLSKDNPGAKIVLTGCLATLIEKNKDKLDPYTAKALSLISAIVPNENKQNLLEIAFSEKNNFSLKTGESACFGVDISGHSGHTRAFVKIQDGCENFCSYCIVPHVRGKIKSRHTGDIIREIETLADNGFHEIVLTGIHLGAFGKDRSEERALEKLIIRIAEIKGILRIRLSSIEINELSDEIIEMARDKGPLCPHFHIPLQSGDKDTLNAMNRRYTPQQFLLCIEKIKSEISRPAITTDVIIGFPGETDMQFSNTVSVCREAAFTRMHVFPFSPRPGTPAYDFPGKIAHETTELRRNEMKSLNHELMLSYHKNFIGEKVNVLVERFSKKYPDMLSGHTERYIEVTYKGGAKEEINSETAVIVEKASASGLKGHRDSLSEAKK